MTTNERTVMAGFMELLDRLGDPPARGAPGETEWWAAEGNALCAFAGQCRNHPLAIEIGSALHAYLEIKSQAKGKVENEQTLEQRRRIQ